MTYIKDRVARLKKLSDQIWPEVALKKEQYKKKEYA